MNVHATAAESLAAFVLDACEADERRRLLVLPVLVRRGLVGRGLLVRGLVGAGEADRRQPWPPR